MNQIIATDGARLDEVVYAFYGSLEPMAIVLEANERLLTKEHLVGGDVVYLPIWEETTQEEERQTLW